MLLWLKILMRDSDFRRPSCRGKNVWLFAIVIFIAKMLRTRSRSSFLLLNHCSINCFLDSQTHTKLPLWYRGLYKPRCTRLKKLAVKLQLSSIRQLACMADREPCKRGPNQPSSIPTLDASDAFPSTNALQPRDWRAASGSEKGTAFWGRSGVA